MDSFPALAPSVPTEAASTAPRRVPPRQRARSTSVSVAPTRERILSAAAQLFAEHGFASTSMPAIAELSGITAGAGGLLNLPGQTGESLSALYISGFFLAFNLMPFGVAGHGIICGID